ncbi:MAG: type II toxin-antitoxin system PemK/MazF family toxin [Nitrospinae bacterium]|nr:type II toxin-antitoxin system PemK/MazF family toxin [Nitrospinota bacterium]
MTKGKVVLVPFPFDDLSTLKVRPVVLLTDPIGEHKHIIAAFITSRPMPEPLPSDIVIGEKHPDFAITGLKVPSTMRLHRLMTIGMDMVKRDLGRISPTLMAEIRTKLLSLI